MRYFVWVGSVLLALLFIGDAWLPKLPAVGIADALTPVVRIHSDQKWPERIVYDTSAPMVRLASSGGAAGSPMIAVDLPKLRNALAELQTVVLGRRLPIRKDQREPSSASINLQGSTR